MLDPFARGGSMSFTVFWACALEMLVVVQAIALALVYRYQASQRGRNTPVAALLVIVVWLVGAVALRSMVGGLPTFVDDVRSGKISNQSVRVIQIVEDPTAAAPERILAEIRNRRGVITCLNALANSSVGLGNRNHPQSLYRGSVRVVMVDGVSHLVPFFVMCYEGELYAYFYSFHGQDYGFDQNCYESADMVPFLAQHDPRFPK